MATLVLGGTTVASPSKITVSTNDISKIDRNAAGLTVIDRQTRKRQLEIEWNYLTNAQAATLLGAAGSSTVFFSVVYVDPQDNASKTITCYATERSLSVLRNVSGAPYGWEDVKLTLVEQ